MCKAGKTWAMSRQDTKSTYHIKAQDLASEAIIAKYTKMQTKITFISRKVKESIDRQLEKNCYLVC